jgi:hypothetical protein
MLSFPVFAKLQPRPDPQVALSRLVQFSIPFIEALCFQTLTHSFPQRRSHNPFPFNRFPTLSIATGVYTPDLDFPLSLAARERTKNARFAHLFAISPLLATLAFLVGEGGGGSIVR